MPVSRKRKNRGKGAGARERARRRKEHNLYVRGRMRETLGIAPGDDALLANMALLLPSLARKAGKIL